MAYYSPYHSKYNPIERVFGVLENYWNGDPLRTVRKALEMAEGMTYNKVNPVVGLVTNVYAKRVILSNRQRRLYEKALNRLQDLGKWFITISPDKAKRFVCWQLIWTNYIWPFALHIPSNVLHRSLLVREVAEGAG